MPRTLVVLHVSPWSERARWALDHHGLVYRTVEHVPLFGEPLLRWRVGRIRPVDDAWIRLGPATRTLWTRPALAEAYADLLVWRDTLYAERRARQ